MRGEPGDNVVSAFPKKSGTRLSLWRGCMGSTRRRRLSSSTTTICNADSESLLSGVRDLQPSPNFIELAPPSTPSLWEGDTLELVRASGSRVILRLAHANPKDLGPLVQLFLRQRS